MPIRYTAIILDLSNVFFNTTSGNEEITGYDTKVSSRRVWSSLPWTEYECGKISETKYYERIGKLYNIQPLELANLLRHWRETLHYNGAIFSLILSLRNQYGSNLQVYAMSDMPMADYAAVRERWSDSFWSIFDDIFTSFSLSMRKPCLRFYRHVLTATEAVPEQTYSSTARWRMYSLLALSECLVSS